VVPVVLDEHAAMMTAVMETRARVRVERFMFLRHAVQEHKRRHLCTQWPRSQAFSRLSGADELFRHAARATRADILLTIALQISHEPRSTR
jgi:hypothetical protein